MGFAANPKKSAQVERADSALGVEFKTKTQAVGAPDGLLGLVPKHQMVVGGVKFIEVARLATALAYAPKGDFAKPTQLVNHRGDRISLSEVDDEVAVPSEQCIGGKGSEFRGNCRGRTCGRNRLEAAQGEQLELPAAGLGGLYRAQLPAALAHRIGKLLGRLGGLGLKWLAPAQVNAEEPARTHRFRGQKDGSHPWTQ